jgi:hypothetical protein
MSELELSLVLGLLHDPTQNRLPIDEELKAELQHLNQIFQVQQLQQQAFKRPTQNLWREFLPWHSLN